MNFPFGIEVEAAIYAKSALVSMSQQPEYVAQTTDDIKKHCISLHLDSCTHDEWVEVFVAWVESDVKKENWDICDEDGVAWFIGLYCKTYTKIFPSESFTKIFTDCFKEYFNNK